MQSQRGLLHDETPARQVGKHPVHWCNGAGQAILDSHQGEIGQAFPDVVQGSTAAQGVVQEVQRRELDLTTVLGGLRKIGIPLKIQGTIKGGRTVMFEAKFTAADRMEQSRVLQSQQDYMDRHQALGARCFVIAGFSSGMVYCVPWDIWKTMKDHFGRKYVTEADLEKYQVQTAWNGTLLLLN